MVSSPHVGLNLVGALLHTDRALAAAASMLPLEIRSLDAIHLASASILGRSLTAVVTYDERMAGAARGFGWKVVAP